MSRQKRYTSEDQILTAIDSCYVKHLQLLKDAENNDTIADLKFKDARTARPCDLEALEIQGRFHREAAKKLRKAAARQLEVRAKKLGRTLAAFRTETLTPGDDRAVVMQK